MLVHNKGKYVRHAAGATLLPGTNDITEKEFKRFSSHPIAKKWIDKGEIVAHEEKSLVDMNAKPAIEIVEDTFDKSKLEEWLDKEDRSTVIEAINKQLDQLDGEGDGGPEGDE
ncbi:hypothetical protein [Salibacterium aidingense]|uniref:hypothetical protein n=1 Tax=Salibacterium aidingense TaxID=384933 RepID=UPI0004047977|nr:hypothetical protein [Salibacterium aidingense]